MSSNLPTENFISYSAFDTLLQELVAQGKTTGHTQSQELIDFGRINLQRMHRVYKTTQLLPELNAVANAISQALHFVVITEGWCGDSAQILPVLQRIAEAGSKITLQIILRDDNAAFMDRYLTNGARSIPKLICFDSTYEKEFFVWGPRPAALQKEALRLLSEHVSKEEKGLFVQKWYNENKTLAIQEELLQLLQAIK